MTAVSTDVPAVGVSIVICAYTLRRWDDLRQAVRSVQEQTVPAAEIILVIDYCEELLHRAQDMWPHLVVVANREQRGLSGARNTGISVASEAIVAFLDDDAVAEPAWLERLTACYTGPNIVAVGGQVEPSWQAGRRPTWFPQEFDWVVGCTHPGLPRAPAPVRNLIGANMSFRSDVLASVGGFRSQLGRIGTTPLGCEETELCIRAGSRPKAQIVYEPRARVLHSVPARRATWRYFLSRCLAEGRSKATVAALVGPQRALSSERAYLRRTLPRGVKRALGDTAKGHPQSLLVALAIVAGVATTGTGYALGRARSLTRRMPRLALPGALALWILSLKDVPLRAMTDLGLVSVLPVTFWLSLAVLAASFCAHVRDGRAAPRLLLAHVVALIVILHATPTLLYGTLRYSWAWKHVGVVDYLVRHGRVNPNIDQLSAYQSWPGFFALNALLIKAAGLPSSLGYAPWAPPVFNLLILGPLWLIVRQFSTDRRLVWSALWLFYLGSWVGQDYFSPQALAFVLYLTVLAVALQHWRGRSVRSDTLLKSGTTTVHSGTAAVLAFLIPLLAAIASSHQLTPFMLVVALGGLVAFRYRQMWSVLVLAALFTFGWIAYAAREFLASNLYWIVQSIGHPNANTKANFINLAKVSPGQALVAMIDRALSAVMWLAAAIGLWRRRHPRRADRPLMLLVMAPLPLLMANSYGGRRRQRRAELPMLLLIVSPLPLLVANSYGGEMLFRVYLFGLPFIAFFAAASIFPRLGHIRFGGLTLMLVTSVLLFGFAFAYYGKERANYFTPQEVSASNFVYRIAPKGSLVVSSTSNFPWAFKNYEFYQYEFFALDTPQLRRAAIDAPANTFRRLMDDPRYPRAYLILTRSEAAEATMTGILPAGSIQAIERALLVSGRFTAAYRNADAIVFVLSPARSAA